MSSSFQEKSLNKQMNIIALTGPLFIEMLLRTALGTCDIFMLSHYSDKAVSAVGLINQVTFFFVLISMMISSGTGVLVSQNLGAALKKKAAEINVASIILACIFGLSLSLLGASFSKCFVGFYSLEPIVAKYAYQYLMISVCFTFALTFGVVSSTILRSYGFAKFTMYINLFAGFINIIGNYIALYEPFGLPVYGVSGVASATVFSQVISALLMFNLIRHKNIPVPFAKFRQIKAIVYKKILSIGVMNAGETLAYNLSQLAIMYLVAKMGTPSLAAYTYAQTIARFSFSFSIGLGQAGGILTSYYIGKGWIDNICKKIKKYYIVGFLASVGAAIIFYLLRYPLIEIFTDDPQIVPLFATLIAGSIFVESGRAGNLIFISALKGAGDIKFPVKCGMVSMWTVGVGLTYVLGLQLHWGVIGAWIAIGSDEWARSLVMTWRWYSMKWTNYSLVN